MSLAHKEGLSHLKTKQESQLRGPISLLPEIEWEEGARETVSRAHSHVRAGRGRLGRKKRRTEIVCGLEKRNKRGRSAQMAKRKSLTSASSQ